MIYLDHIAAAPVDPRVVEAMLPYLRERFGSPLSVHRHGEPARQALDAARRQVAALIGAGPEEIVFTASGTEADNLAVKGLAQAYAGRGQHVVVSAIEHQAVLHAARALERQGFAVARVPVDRTGRVDPERVRRAVRPDTTLISILLASDEIGTLQPIREIAAVAHEHGAVMHTDAVAAAGCMPVDVRALGIDALSLSAPLLGGPKGAGALYLRQGTRLRPLIDGGGQEDGRRGGHENIPAIAGFGKAAELAAAALPERADRLTRLRDRLIQGVMARVPEVRLNGHPVLRLPGHVSLLIRDADGESMTLLLDARGVAVSVGSSCASRAAKPSHVLRAIGRTPAEAQSSLLLTMGPATTEDDIDRTIEALAGAAAQLRAIAGTG
jgi:cysteine desulfurase